MTGPAERRAEVLERIAAACAACDRDPSSVELLAVSKRQPVTAIRSAFDAGQRAFGENRVQELATKATELRDVDLEWHMVGSIQTNKVRDLVAVPRLGIVHSLDRRKLAARLQEELAAAGHRLTALLQVNATGEEQKHGVEPEQVLDLARFVVAECPSIDLHGVMGMGPLEGDPAPVFAEIARMCALLREATGLPLPMISMGMTGDLEAAVAAGSTLVRVGTGVFGPRS